MGSVPISGLALLFKLVFTLWLFAIAYLDARTATIPNALTLPMMAILGGVRMGRAAGYALSSRISPLGQALDPWMGWFSDAQAVGQLMLMVISWAFCFALWEGHIVGGGDAKTLMGILALFPSVDFVVFLAAAVLVLSLPLLWLRWRGRRLRDVAGSIGQRLSEGALLPTEQQLAEEGRPYAWTFCLPGAIYLWFLW
jgi:Flp pilus assembly protein protease CpaA